MIRPPQALDLHRPLRVHVVGNSTAVLVEPEHGPRDGGTYGENLPRLLAARGVPSRVSHSGTWFGRVSDSLTDYERQVRDHFPDVLVVNFGIIECQSNALPTPLARHLMTWRRTSRRGAAAYRERVLPALWPTLRRYQRWAAARDDGRTHRLTPRRFTTDLERLVTLARKDCGCLVLLLDIDPPGDRVEHWLPGTRRRAVRYNELIGQVAAGFDDDVRVVPAGGALPAGSPDLPDGLHRSPDGHARTAELLSAEIIRWLAR